MDIMMLGALDIALIVATTLLATALVMGLTLLALRRNRRRSIASQFALVVAGAVLSIVAATAAVMVEMYVSPHDLSVFLWVVGVSALVSLSAAWLIIRRMTRTSTDALIASAQQVGEGAVVEADRPGWREFDDVSAQLAETSEKLAAARDEIAKLDGARRQFLAWISHDLRTPLAGIRALADAWEDGFATEPAATAELIRGRVDTLDRMVDDLFRLSKLETGTLTLRPELVPLLDVVSDAVADVQEIATSRRIRIVPAGIDGHMLWADPRELSRAIGNLLANAVRHAPADTEIVIDAASREPTPETADPLPVSEPSRQRPSAGVSDSLVISVMDHGSGVASEDLGRIFDVGWRASGSRDTEDAGAGLGLAIVRGIVEAHGGEVGADNLDDGFVVTLALPAER
ncbi:sensor histidine kinase KdpD [Microbacterium sp. G2-8]|uniref:sensor histidine kinase n=1 Tax=Microbacterium sp. G2-8 TaxID=2842454 RepID=UPI0021AAA49F|nr:HAMP domain-containing sensor histidine kinase [Microbacterium sp. G2-8]